MPKRYGTPDAETPAWTRDEFARAQRAGDVFPPDVLGEAPPTRVRGPQVAATKQLVSLRLDRDLLAQFREGGRGWQSRINAALRDWVAAHVPRARRKAARG